MSQGVITFFLCAVTAASVVQIQGQLARTRTGVDRSPYTAHYKIAHTQKLADGNVIRRESTQTTAVDTQGRQMNATTLTMPYGSQTPRTMVFVFDPAGHTNTNWAIPGQQATVTSMPGPGTARGCPANSPEGARIPASGRSDRVKTVVEPLGADTIQGIEVRGRRMTTTFAVGEVGNQSPLVLTSEVWTATSPGLSGMLVRETSDDPRSGTKTEELISYEQGDPDPAIFEPPAGYGIVKNTTESSCPTLTNSAPQP